MPPTRHVAPKSSRGTIDRLLLLVGSILVLAGLAAAPASASISEWETSWTLNPSEAEGSEQSLDAVGCSETKLCMAVGTYANGEGSGQLVEVWNDEEEEWSYAPSSTGAQLNDAACLSLNNACFAPGGKEGQAWTQAWTKGTGWTPMTTPTPPGASSSEFNGGGCSAVEFAQLACFAVGSKTVAEVETALAMRWDFSMGKFVIQTLPSQGESSVLNDVSCNRIFSCVAVGYSVEAGGEKRPLAMRWDGSTWSIESVPNSSAGGNDTYLEDVSCVGSGAAARCIAVGANEGGSPQVGVSMYWNGGGWYEVALQEPPGLEGDFSLHGVACLSTSECHAVGEVETSGWTEILVEEWDGSEWTWTGVPNPPNPRSGLAGVSCIATAEACMAVGETENERIDTLGLYGQ